ncbi:MAG TPA: SlyX family protein [Gammaproteobacteria bacterium]|nr:SlyX family protein [Gammaproteobacteria bacterium]
MKINEQIIELESRLAFQENSIVELNEIITDQQGQIDRLTATVAMLDSRLSLLTAAAETVAKPEDEIPPHY